MKKIVITIPEQSYTLDVEDYEVDGLNEDDIHDHYVYDTIQDRLVYKHELRPAE